VYENYEVNGVKHKRLSELQFSPFHNYFIKLCDLNVPPVCPSIDRYDKDPASFGNYLRVVKEHTIEMNAGKLVIIWTESISFS
jgi:hypothetical protein